MGLSNFPSRVPQGYILGPILFIVKSKISAIGLAENSAVRIAPYCTLGLNSVLLYKKTTFKCRVRKCKNLLI